MVRFLSDLTDMPAHQREGLAAIVKAGVNEALTEVRRKYTVEAAVDGAVVVRNAGNVVLTTLLNAARDELVMRVTADVDMLMSPETAARAVQADTAAAEKAKAKAEIAREEARAAELRWKERQAETDGKRLASEEYLRTELDARWRKKEGELSRKITNCDRRMAEADKAARARVQAELGVIRVVSTWLRWMLNNVGRDDTELRASLLELDAVDWRDI